MIPEPRPVQRGSIRYDTRQDLTDDADVLDAAASVIERRSRRPRAIFVRALVKVLRSSAARMRAEAWTGHR